MNDFIELRYIIVTIIKWWWLFILTMLLAALLAFALTPAEKQLYRATTTLLVGQSIQSTKPSVSEISYDEKLALTYANIAKRQPILQGVVEALGLKENWLALKDRLSVQTIPQTQLLEISVLADSEQMARAEADEVARQLMLIRTSLLQKPEDSETQQQIQQRLTDIQSKINVGRSRISAMEGKLISAVTVAQIQEIQNNIDSLEKLITQWETNATQLLIALESTKAPNNLSVIEAAQITTVANAYQVYVNMLIAGVLGLGLALCFVFLREYLDDTVKSAEDVEHRLGLVTLGEISRIKSKNVQEQLMQKQSVFSKASEEYRLLRSKIQFLVSDWSSKVIMVTSPTPSEQQSIMVANLGVVLAQAGLRTIIVDTDLRQPMQHKIFQLSNQQGLSELLLSPTLEFDGHIQMTGVTNLRVLTAGELAVLPSENLGSPRMRQIFDRLIKLADVVLCDSAQAVSIADALVLSSLADGTLLAIEAGKVDRSVAEQAVHNLQQAGANLLGAVLMPLSANKVTAAKPVQFTPPVLVSKNGALPEEVKTITFAN